MLRRGRGHSWHGIGGPAAAKRRDPHQSGRISGIVRLQAAAVHHLSSASSPRLEIYLEGSSIEESRETLMTAVHLKIPALSSDIIRKNDQHWQALDSVRFESIPLAQSGLSEQGNLVVGIKLTSLNSEKLNCINLSNRVGVTSSGHFGEIIYIRRVSGPCISPKALLKIVIV